VLNGTKLFIRDSHTADRMVVVARTGADGEEGISLFIVDAGAAGITQSPIRTISSERQNEVKFENVRVPAANLMGQEGKAWPVFKKIANKATVLECATWSA
jgi:alkylation response protein AidB-like acyl-CoA dehydrogenase